MQHRPTTGTAFPRTSGPDLDRLRAVLGGWSNSLLDMGGRNRLLNFRHTRTATLEIKAPGSAAVLASLAKGWDFAPVAEEGGESSDAASRPDAPGLVTQKATQAALDAAVRQLRQKSGQMYNDYGLWVLWLGVGMLDWREAGAHEVNSAPLLLVPVELRPDGRKGMRLRLAEEQERIHNPALAVKLDRLGVDWTPVAGLDPNDLGSVLSAARRIAAAKDRWSVDERLVLGLFSSYKEAMYQDLQQNEDRILAHPLVRAVALGPDSGLPDDALGFDPPDLDRIDDIQLPEQTPLVLDADASQRQCIAAALDGRSFVMSGPPGTGKSQTITNMIAALMHAGRSVLFVSEKAAALDVVRNRLRGVGLGDFVMALHSGDTTKKAVATELGRVLTTEARVTGAAAHELDRARRLREELSAYAAAMNQCREPLGRALHDVLGRLVLLDQARTPQLTLRTTRNGVRSLSAAALQDVTAAAGAVSRAWRPAVEGEGFVWRGLVGPAALTVLTDAADALGALRTAVERRPFALTTPEPRTEHDLRQTARTMRAGLPGRRAAEPNAALPDDLPGRLAQFADLFGMPKPQSADAAFALLELSDLVSASHRPPHSWFDPATLARVHQAAAELHQALGAQEQARVAAADVFGEQVLTAQDLPALAGRFAERHRGVMSRFSAQFKADRDAAAALTRSGQWNKSITGRLPQAVAWQQATAWAAQLTQSHTALLGRWTPRTVHDLADLDRVLAVADRIVLLTQGTADRSVAASRLADGVTPDPLPALLASSVRGGLADWCDATEQRADRWFGAATALLGLFDAPRTAQLTYSLLGTLDQAGQTVDALRADPQGPQEWQAFRDGMAVLTRNGAGDLIPRAAERGVQPEQLPAVVEYALLRSWADDLLATDPRLRTTRSADLDARVVAYQEADRRLVAAAGGAVIEACNGRRPRRFTGGSSAVITRQAGLKSRHMPVRELLHRTRDVVQTIKPCFMMSPLTVSQLLPADFSFDVVVFDEASQVRPGDAVNCIYRGTSLVVAGDAKQLPPTSFFDSAVEEDSDEYDADVPDSFESLLDACKAGAVQELPLRWHYRSRHEDLITFSNRSFYKNAMVTFPGSLDHGNDVGVAFFAVAGVYDRGGRRDNVIEAERVAERVVHHFDTRPGTSLGVVALSQAQASAIDLAVQQARLRRPDLDHCFTEDRLDGFFVKNLESVQGDERDVMIMSIGYGPDEHAKLGLNFGPINKDGGWRRLNVAVTRARYRMEVVASFNGTVLRDSQNESVQHLKRYLEYAENGPAVLAHDTVQAVAAPESPFEESVLSVLTGWGYDVQPQVGVAGYRIDLGLRHPDAPGAYAMGIECDGAMYHSSKAARDRDRLREQVLAGLGWKLHRIWGTDWYRDRTAAEQRLRDAVERAIAQAPPSVGLTPQQAADPVLVPAAGLVAVPAQRGVPGVGARLGTAGGGAVSAAVGTAMTAIPAQAVTLAVEHERVPVSFDAARTWSDPYEAYVGSTTTAHELHTPEARAEVRRLLTRIIATEGPLHEDLVVLRVREAWGVGRAGSRIRDNIVQTMRALARTGAVTIDGPFVDMVGGSGLKARYPQDGQTPRKVVYVAPAERRLALYELAAECPGMTPDELSAHACEFFGWRRLGSDIKAALQADIAALYGQGRLTGEDGRITAVR